MLQLVASTEANEKSRKEILLKEKRFKLARLLRCTEDMLNHAKKGDWDMVGKIDFSRRTDVRELFSQEAKEETSLISESLATIVYLNEQIAILVKQARKESLRNLKKIEKNKNAISIYQNN